MTRPSSHKKNKKASSERKYSHSEYRSRSVSTTSSYRSQSVLTNSRSRSRSATPVSRRSRSISPRRSNRSASRRSRSRALYRSGRSKSSASHRSGRSKSSVSHRSHRSGRSKSSVSHRSHRSGRSKSSVSRRSHRSGRSRSSSSYASHSSRTKSHERRSDCSLPHVGDDTEKDKNIRDSSSDSDRLPGRKQTEQTDAKGKNKEVENIRDSSSDSDRVPGRKQTEQTDAKEKNKEVEGTDPIEKILQNKELRDRLMEIFMGQIKNAEPGRNIPIQDHLSSSNLTVPTKLSSSSPAVPTQLSSSSPAVPTQLSLDHISSSNPAASTHQSLNSSSRSSSTSRSSSRTGSRSTRTSRNKPRSTRTSKNKKSSSTKRGRSRNKRSSRHSRRSNPSNSTNSSNSDRDDDDRLSRYLYSVDLPSDLRDAVRRQIFWIIERLPDGSKLALDQTFENQRQLVTGTIIPAVMKTLDPETFPVSEEIVYEMVHARHKHQREEYLKSQRSAEFLDKQARRKHQNSRRNDKRVTRSRTIDHLRTTNDPLIRKFSEQELRPIKDNSAYHSPELSETDDDQPLERKIVTKDLKWRSSTLRSFLRNYVDRIFSESSKIPKKRPRIHDTTNYYEEEQSAPFRAPKWTLTGYKGSLKASVKQACSERSSNTLPDPETNEGQSEMLHDQ